VLVKGTGKHFCAGGDVVCAFSSHHFLLSGLMNSSFSPSTALIKCFDKEDEWPIISEHWYQQYKCVSSFPLFSVYLENLLNAVSARQNHLLATCSKPIVSFMNGVTCASTFSLLFAFHLFPILLTTTAFLLSLTFLPLPVGGGVGYACHGAFRVVTETTQVAMPEVRFFLPSSISFFPSLNLPFFASQTKIGLFPDVGANFLYSRLDGELGTYLALTSTTLVGADAFFAGLASHYVPSAQLPALEHRLLQLSSATTHGDVNAVIDDFTTSEEELRAAYKCFPYQGALRNAIDYCFSPSSVPAILSRLVQVETGAVDLSRLFSPSPSASSSSATSFPVLQKWARDTHTNLRLRSPTSLTLTLKALRIGRLSSLEQVLARDVRLTIACCSPYHNDFTTGVDALLVKKLKPEAGERPDWRPATVEEVNEDYVEKTYFSMPPPFEKPETKVPDFEGYRRERRSRGAQPFDDYVDSPHRRWALPTEKDVEAEFTSSTGGVRSKEHVVEELVRRWKGKQGVKEKVEEVWERKNGGRTEV
jgi:3-hydroxyisobutyryl-CoA hydrolase